MELFDILDANGNPTGEVHNRAVPLPKNSYHLVVLVAVIDSKKRILLTFRHPDKFNGNCWEISGGSALSGEDSLTAVQRELAEETGIRLPKEKFRFIKRSKCRTSFQDFYHATADVPLEDIVCQEGETTAAKWADKEEFIELVESGRFCSHIYKRHYDVILKLMS